MGTQVWRRARATASCAVGLVLIVAVGGCGDDDDDGGGDSLVVPATYSFESAFDAGQSSVSYNGQTMRQVLIEDMVSFISSLTEAIDSGRLSPAPGEITDALNYYFEFDSDTSGGDPIDLSTSPPLLQVVYDDISTDKDLVGKIAGNDATGQHKDWSTEFRGWSDDGGESPESLVRAFFDELDQLAVARADGEPGLDPNGVPISAVYITPSGRDLKQLIEKFLLMSVNYSQGTDDYLDNDLPDHGINSNNLERSGSNTYTSLEHVWDEGFGYFGAARDYADYTDDEAAGSGGREEYASGYHDSDGDGAIDLESEINFHASVNAAKRDRGSSDENPTDFSQDAIDGFLRGRAIINSAVGEALTEAQMADLVQSRDQAVLAWERAIAATVVHYINDTLAVMDEFGTAGYSFADHAKVWSEMKGFALGLQFNPHGRLNDSQFGTLHELMRDAPVLPGESGGEEYRQALLQARELMGDAYGFADSNLLVW